MLPSLREFRADLLVKGRPLSDAVIGGRQEARDWIGRFTTALKTLDALHLAIASAEGATLVTSDENLAKAADALAVDVIFLGTPIRDN